MDTSKKYIKMCEEAKEIQPIKTYRFIFHYDEGSFFYHRRSKQITTNKGTSFEENDIYLPRQDQLQEIYFDYMSKEMEDDEDPNAVKLNWAAFVLASINELKLFNLAWYRGHPPFESYEQLWLALIMISNYSKYWDDDKKKWMKRTNGY